MTAKEYLLELRRVDNQLGDLLKAKEEMDETQACISHPIIDGVAVQISRSNDPPWMKHLIQREELFNRIAEKWDELITLKMSIIKSINSLNDSKHIVLLLKRYVDYKPFEQIADEMGYSCNYVLHLHRDAIEAFEGAMN